MHGDNEDLAITTGPIARFFESFKSVSYIFNIVLKELKSLNISWYNYLQESRCDFLSKQKHTLKKLNL